MSETIEMFQIKLGPAYFRKELHSAYSQWGQAFWRENIQNSVDAGCSIINVNLAPKGDNLVVDFADNGCGMSREILDNVFFCLGETTKTTSATVGGFGRARIMTHFAQENYEILTQYNHVKGSGQAYGYLPKEGYTRGCRMIIETHPYDKYRDRIDLEQELRNFLSDCQLPCDVFINGVKHTDWTYRRNIVRELTFGTVHVNKSAVGKNDGGVLIVRVSGVCMYKTGIRPSVRVILEIDPTKSRDVLNSNRDSLQYKFQNELNDFITEINVETASALKPKQTEFRPIRGTGSFVSYKKQVQECNLQQTSTNGSLINMAHSVLPPKVNILPETVQEETAEANNEPIYLDEEARNKLFDILMVVDHAALNEQQKKVVNSYNPTNWKHNGNAFVGANKSKLLLIWKTICHHVVLDALEQFGMDRIYWGVGWNFGNDAATHKKHDDIHFLTINPIDEKGNLKYSIRSKKDLFHLFMLACHEVTHIACKYHDEDFAASLTYLTAKALNRFNQIKNGVQDIYKVKMI